MKIIRIKKTDLVKEHKNLIRLLKYGNKEQLRKEAIAQSKELKRYLK